MPKFTLEIDLDEPFFHNMGGESLDVSSVTYALRHVAEAIDLKDEAEAPLDVVLSGTAYTGTMVMATYKATE